LTHLQDEVIAGTIDMVLHVGDMAYNMDDDNGTRGDEFMRQIQPIAAYVPYMVCLGNHEYNYNFSHYSQRFSGITGQESGSNTNWFYSFDISYVHFVGFSTEVYYHADLNATLDYQYRWLQKDLSNVDRAKTPWVILFGHRPMYCSNVDDMPDCSTDAKTLRWGVNGTYPMEDLLMEYNVDLFFTAHEHSYERTWPVYRGTIDSNQTNHTYYNAKYPVHIVTGAAGCQEDLDYYDDVFYGPWSVIRSSSYGYGHLSIINSTHLLWRQFLAEGQEGQDELWLTKDKNHRFKGPSTQQSTCDEYCFATCLSAAIRNDRSKENCIKDCDCMEEALDGQLNELGKEIRIAKHQIRKRTK